MKGDILKKIGIIVFIIVLLCFFLLINFFGYKKKNNDVADKITTTIKIKTTEKMPQVFGDKIFDKESGYIAVDGVPVEIKLKTFKAVMGFEIDYIYEEYTPIKKTNMILNIMKNDNPNVWIKIEVLSEDNYYEQYQNSLKDIYDESAEIEGFKYQYEFFRANGTYLKITRCINNDNIDKKIELSMEYMINSIVIPD